MLNEASYKARGIFTEDMLQTIDKVMHKWILSSGAHLDGIYSCPHHPEHGVYPYKQVCECQKPHTGLKKEPKGILTLIFRNLLW